MYITYMYMYILVLPVHTSRSWSGAPIPSRCRYGSSITGARRSQLSFIVVRAARLPGKARLPGPHTARPLEKRRALRPPRVSMSRKGRGGGGADDVAKDNVLQAVLLADSFTKKTFRPITLEQPKVLLPLVNVPMLQYTIEFLASSGVGELFIFCAGHAQQIEEYIERASEWRDRWLKGMRIHCICRSNCLSAGDALREIDSMGVVRSDSRPSSGSSYSCWRVNLPTKGGTLCS